eukprot:CAMPEP_0119520488 /NCGR_PEP_ID=MMETSP1344-20130328/36492_1 /TAXON_ID=236787 /ORGANISM="Florenciella parvula, Strain CCMP2471" /LENGTH=303 /DNA_ID=CAMNT_0007558381 /DNA_START=28 /DNA_END=939 /DNA_ORIENTATION=+
MPRTCNEASFNGEVSFGEARVRSDQIVDNARVREGRGVAERVRLEGGDLAKDTAHDLARAGLWKAAVGPVDRVRGSECADARAHHTLQLFHQLRRGLLAVYQGHVHVQCLALGRMVDANARGLGGGRVQHHRALDLSGANVVARHDHNVICPPRNGEVAVLVAPRVVTSKVVAREAKVSLFEPVLVAPDRAQCRGPRALDRQKALGLAIELSAAGIEKHGIATEKRRLGGAWFLNGVLGRNARDHVRASLRLPPCVNHRTFAVANNFVVPPPCLRVDGLAHGTQEPQAVARRLRHVGIARPHE